MKIAAIVAERGHYVILLEKDAELGGQVGGLNDYPVVESLVVSLKN